MTGAQVGGWSVPPGCPVFDVDGERVGRVVGVEEDCLVVDRGEVFLDHVPVAAVVGFDGRSVRLGVTMDEVHRGEAEQACRHLRRQGVAPPVVLCPGAEAARPVLAEVLSHLRSGDTLVVWRLDRLLSGTGSVASQARNRKG